jgi:hypothetical protein
MKPNGVKLGRKLGRKLGSKMDQSIVCTCVYIQHGIKIAGYGYTIQGLVVFIIRIPSPDLSVNCDE